LANQSEMTLLAMRHGLIDSNTAWNLSKNSLGTCINEYENIIYIFICYLLWIYVFLNIA
jgi:hypothetical protein